MLLEYQKEILENINEDATLCILSKGLRYIEMLSTLLKLYSNERYLTFILNMSEYETKYLLNQNIEFLTNINGLTTTQRTEKYKKGGIFYGSSVALITDFLNKNVQIEKISTIIILNADNIEEDSAISFICYLFKENNSLALIKAFTSNAININDYGLEKIARSLCLNKIMFYPRFHEIVKLSLPEISVNQIYLKQNDLMGEITVLIEDIIKKIYSNENKGLGSFDYIKLLIYRQNSRDIADFKNILLLLMNSDSLTTFLFYNSMLECQKQSNINGSWIFDESCHILFDLLKSKLIKDIEKSSEDPALFIYNPEMCKFCVNINNSQQNAVEINTSVDDLNILEQDKFNEDENSDELNLYAEILESKSLSGFYLTNPKIKQSVEILNKNLNIKTVVLVQNRTIRKAVKRAFRSLSVIDNVSVQTHVEFLHSDDINFERIILFNPDLLSIRNVECVLAKGLEATIYILHYKNSIEEQKFLEELREEKFSFEKLIEDRSNLPLRIELDRFDMEDDLKYKIVVDSREMRSKLPFYLYKSNNEIEVKVLDIGDYLLDEKRCIERKSIDDFISSLNSGRLYQQAQKMVYSYKNPILLLEFNEVKPSLCDFDNIENFRNSYTARFCLFLYNFPHIKIIWSNSHINSARIIRDIQQKQDEIQTENSKYDPSLMDTLLCIPGINSFNLNRICGEFNNLYDLSTSDKDRLEKVVDSVSAEKIYNFFRSSNNQI